MAFKIKKNPGIWFEYPEGGRVQLRTSDIDDYLRINQACTTNEPFVYEKKDDKGNPLPPVILNHEITDRIKQSFMINDCQIVAWEKLPKDEDGNDIPCTPENKSLLMRLEDSTFRDFVSEKLKALEEAIKAKKEVEVKNLLPT